jgi:hypothetical protein
MQSAGSTPQIMLSSFITLREDVIAIIRWRGRRADNRRAIKPDSVNTKIKRVFISSAANAAASHSARLTRPVCRPAILLMMLGRS